MVGVVDFGSQYTHLITRRLRALGYRAEIFPPTTDLSKQKNLSGIILSGGPGSVYEPGSPTTPIANLKLKVPILGICYGHQYLSKAFGGQVAKGASHEYGRETIHIEEPGGLLFRGLKKAEKVWLSHGDQVTKLPRGFEVTAKNKNCPVVAFENRQKQIFGIQFHPEVFHTEHGLVILQNFLKICGAQKDWKVKDQVSRLISKVKETIGDEAVLIALSGGVDSLVAARVIHRAVGDRLVPVFVDNGLLRKNEAWEVAAFVKKLGMKNFHKIDASRAFLSRLKKVGDPEKKRRIIGRTFIEIFNSCATKLGKKEKIKFLAQGTIYPDRIESAAASAQAHKIKSHHNLIIPKIMKLKLIEPLADFYKDEVREIGKVLGLPAERLNRHPFPGPGLAVRVLGPVVPAKLKILREADAIFLEELVKGGLYDQIWQAFAVLLPFKSVGVMGDRRTFQYTIALRAVTSKDGMTADWFKFPPEVLERISSRIVNEVSGVNRVVYDITQKPPATIEYE